MAMRNSFLVLLLGFWIGFRKKNSGQLQRKIGKFGQISKIIIFVCTLDHN
jgi:hypothetical protein